MWNDEAYSRRHSLRLRGFDYTSAGAYFVTLCVADRACFLGEIVDGAMCLNPLGRIVAESWLALPTRFPVIELDAFVVMPNHFHGIIILNEIHVPPAPSGSVGAELAPPADKQSATPSLSKSSKFRRSQHRGIEPQAVRDCHSGNGAIMTASSATITSCRKFAPIASNPARWTDDEVSVWRLRSSHDIKRACGLFALT